MRVFKFLWTMHKWTGIVLGLVFVNMAVTGYLLLIKKDHAWLQPPVQTAASGRVAQGGVADFATLQRVFRAVFAAGHPDFRDLDDIDRIDFRPGKRVHKVRSKHNYSELQVDAVTGEVLGPAGFRACDLIEQLHDGTFFGAWVHGWIMPVVAGALLFLVVSGVYIWLAPVLRKRRRRAENRS